MTIRLIEIIDIECSPINLSLREFLEPQMPEYATLSHTWESEEVTYQEILAISKNPLHPATKKIGYQKIIETCRKAKQNGISYAWVDACCIDKTNSSEINEAINSMYRWYQKAKICFAFLTDFKIAETSIEIGLPTCRWFTRGWCLQELIAPQKLEFFDADWTHVGSKADLKCLISNITRIDEQALSGTRSINSIPVARKMSWAAERVTTREEDIAYCLLGIFDVNMPMFYGEGRKAFRRLQEEIIKTSNDLSIFAFRNESTYNAELYSDLFAASPKDFIGCGSLMDMGTAVNWDSAFSLTNKGLYFRRVKLEVNPESGLYTMSLNCKLSDFRIAKLSLRKVGPGLFVKYNCQDADTESIVDVGSNACFSMETEEAYIITQVSPLMQYQLVNSEMNAIHFRSAKQNISKSLQVIQSASSSNRWDPARMQFLTAGDKFCAGYWKLFLDLSQSLTGSCDALSSYCYMVCGVENTDSSNPRAWVRLCSLEGWRELEATIGTITQLPDTPSPLRTDCPTDKITLYKGLVRPVTITASIAPRLEGEKSFFELDIDITKNLEREGLPSEPSPALFAKYTPAMEATPGNSRPGLRSPRRMFENLFPRKKQIMSRKFLDSDTSGHFPHATEEHMASINATADQEVVSEGPRSLTSHVSTKEREYPLDYEQKRKQLGNGCIPWPMIYRSRSKQQ